MKININEQKELSEIEITISCPYINEEVQNIISTLRTDDKRLVGIQGETISLIDIHDIFYIESVDKKTFLYTYKEVYETKSRLYELEDKLKILGFIRISKSSIISLKRISTIMPDIGRRLVLTLENKEKLVVSRQFVSEFKSALGI